MNFLDNLLAKIAEFILDIVRIIMLICFLPILWLAQLFRWIR